MSSSELSTCVCFIENELKLICRTFEHSIKETFDFPAEKFNVAKFSQPDDKPVIKQASYNIAFIFLVLLSLLLFSLA